MSPGDGPAQPTGATGIPANLASWGRCRWGGWLHQLENVGTFGTDRRWASTLVTDDSTGLRAAIAVHTATGAVRFPGLEDAQPDDAWCFVGGPARLLGGAAVQAGGSPEDAGHALGALLRRVREQWPRRRVVAAGIPEPQLAYFLRAMDAAPPRHGGVRSWLDCAGAARTRDVVRGLGSQERATWAQDERRRTAAGVRGVVRTGAALAELPWQRVAELVAAVAANNGERAPARLTALRLQRWRQAARYLAFTVHTGDELAGITLARVDGDALVLNDVGLTGDAADRHALYTELVFNGPLDYATANGLRRVEFGVGHDLVKRSRGARQESQWNLSGRWRT